jgi:hypothetical protein
MNLRHNLKVFRSVVIYNCCFNSGALFYLSIGIILHSEGCAIGGATLVVVLACRGSGFTPFVEMYLS